MDRVQNNKIQSSLRISPYQAALYLKKYELFSEKVIISELIFPTHGANELLQYCRHLGHEKHPLKCYLHFERQSL